MGQPMNQQQLSRIIARKSKGTATRFTTKEVDHCLDLLLEIITEELTQPGGKVAFSNFGILEVVEQRSHGGKLRIGNSNELLDVSSVRHVIKWRPSRKLQRKLRKNTRYSRQISK
jgi:nucleoid DNA-binding protein